MKNETYDWVSEIKDYLVENEFFSIDIKAFLNNSANNHWDSVIFFDELLNMVSATSNFMAVGVMFNYWLDKNKIGDVEAHKIFSALSKRINTILETQKTHSTDQEIDEVVNLLFVILRCYPVAEITDKIRIITLAEKVKALGLTTIIIDEISKKIQSGN